MAAALASFLDVAVNEPIKAGLTFLVFIAGETGRDDAVAQVLEHLRERPSHTILAIGTGAKISLGNRGRLYIEMRIKGAPAHGSTPLAGSDVTPSVAAVLKAGAKLGGRLVETSDLGPATLTCAAFHTLPEATQAVHSEARMTFGRCLHSEENADAVFAEISAAFHEICELQIEVARGLLMHGARIDRYAPLMTLIERALAFAGEPERGYYFSHGALDAGYLSRAGT